jgi:hypothetical protein
VELAVDGNKEEQQKEHFFALGAGLLPAIYVVAGKCRTSSVRWQAQRLFSKANIRGMMDSPLIAAFLQQIIDAEESKARLLTGSSPTREFSFDEMPEEARFMDVTLSGDVEKPDLGRLVCARSPGKPNGIPEIEEYFFELRGAMPDSPQVQAYVSGSVEEGPVRGASGKAELPATRLYVEGLFNAFLWNGSPTQ